MAASLSGILGFFNHHRTRLLGLLAALVAVDVVWVAVAYLVYPGYLDHGEPSVAITSWRLLDGFPAYPAFDSADRTSNIYGPFTYLANALMFLLAGPGIGAGKAAALLAAVSLPAIVFAAQRRHGTAWALVAAIVAAGFVVHGLPFSIWSRPDPFLALLVALAVWAMNASKAGRPEWGKSLAIGVCGGLAAGFKIHAGLYFVPIVLAHGWGRGFTSLAFIGTVGAAALALPFAWEPFSLSNLLSWMPVAVAKASDLGMVTKILRYLLFYLTPAFFFIAALMAASRLERSEITYFAAFVVCVAVVSFAAVKPGAGWYYYFPFLAISVDMVVRWAARTTQRGHLVRAAVAVLAAALLILSVPVQKRFQRALHWQEANDINAEIQDIIAAYAGETMQMGTGATITGYNRTLYKPLLVFAGHPYTLDVGVIIETSANGAPLPEGAITRINDCHTRNWLVPAGEVPFAMTGYYGNPVFDARFRAAFQANYEKRKGFRYFDVWACR